MATQITKPQVELPSIELPGLDAALASAEQLYVQREKARSIFPSPLVGVRRLTESFEEIT